MESCSALTTRMSTRSWPGPGRAGWLYAIVAPVVKPVKIGHAQDVSRRLLDFQTGSPAELMLHSATLGSEVVVAEAQAHLALAHARLSSEWFDLNDRGHTAA